MTSYLISCWVLCMLNRLNAMLWWLQMTSAKRSVSLGVMEDLLSAEAQSAGQVAAWRKSRRLPLLGPAPADICRARCCYL